MYHKNRQGCEQNYRETCVSFEIQTLYNNLIVISGFISECYLVLTCVVLCIQSTCSCFFFGYCFLNIFLNYELLKYVKFWELDLFRLFFWWILMLFLITINYREYEYQDVKSFQQTNNRSIYTSCKKFELVRGFWMRLCWEFQSILSHILLC